jgi:hypothetical protein
MDCADREIMSYVATTGGITGEMIQDLMAEAIEYRFGIVDRFSLLYFFLSFFSIKILLKRVILFYLL